LQFFNFPRILFGVNRGNTKYGSSWEAFDLRARTL
jgi:hypothetical protein